MTASLSLAQMVDLALGTPELGAVNFNVLHTLLHALIRKLDLRDFTADINEADKDFLSRNSISILTSKSDSDNLSLGENGRAPYHSLQDKLVKLEKQLSILDDLPSNEELLSKIKSRGDSERSRPMTDLWQTLQISKRVAANEEGIGKLMSLVEDMMNEMQMLRDDNTSLKNDNTTLKQDFTDLSKKVEEFDGQKDLEERLKQLEQSVSDMKEQLGELAQQSEFVTWSGLEDALSGIRQELTPQEKVVIEMSSQTSRPVSGVKRSESRQNTTPGPSSELIEILEKLGKLTDRHDVLQERVTVVEDELKNKADKSMLEGLSQGGEVPSDLLEKLKEYDEMLKSLQKAKDKTSDLQSVLSDIDKVSDTNADIKIKINELMNAIKDIKQQLNELEEKMAVLKNLIQQIGQSQSGDTSDDKSAGIAVAINNAELKDMADELKKLKSQLTDAEKEILNLKSNEMGMKDVSGQEQVKSYIDKLETSQGLLELESLDLKKQITGLEQELASLKNFMIEQPTPTAALREEVRRYLDEQGLSVLSPVASNRTNKLVASVSETSPAEPAKSISNASKSDSALRNQRKMSSLETNIGDLQKKLSWLVHDNSHKMSVVKDNLHQMESDLRQLAAEVNRNKGNIVPAAGANTNMDSDTLSRLQRIVLELQAETERLSATSQSLLDDAQNKQTIIQKLRSTCEDLQESKADKELVHMEVDVKADKRNLEGKVNRSLFDQTCDELNRMIRDLLGKLTGHEEEWKKAILQLSDDLDGKLDRLEFGPIREHLERELKMLSRKVTQLNMLNLEPGEDDAAGIRKQLLRFHCISCDRPVDMTTQGPVPSIPVPGAMPVTKSNRPYTTFELDNIRQQAKSVPGGQQEILDLYATTRACGGPHTLTYPHRRITRMTHINNLFKDEENGVPVTTTGYRDELDLQGADGHIYKGRTESRLPNIPGTQQGGQPLPIQRAQTSPGSMKPSLSPAVPRSPRPGSARTFSQAGTPVSRPASAQRIMTEVPTANLDDALISQPENEFSDPISAQ